MTYQQQPEYQQPQQQQQVVYQQIVRAPSNGLAITSMILGIVAIAIGVWVPIPFVGLFLAFLAGPLAIVAVILGHMGLGAVRKVGVGKGQAISGLILGYIVIAICFFTTIFWFVALAASSASSTVS